MARVQVFTGSLAAGADELARCTALLAPEERERAARFRFPDDYRRFVVRRARLREVLAGETGADPAKLSFTANPFGKPALAGCSLRFSASHSGERWLLATSECELGADIEQHAAATDWRDIAAGLFAPAEIAALAALDGHAGRRAFYACWARKEAFVKALGLGLSYPLGAFTVAVGPDAALIAGGEGWAIAGLSLAADCAGAVVVADDGLGIDLRMREPALA